MWNYFEIESEVLDEKTSMVMDIWCNKRNLCQKVYYARYLYSQACDILIDTFISFKYEGEYYAYIKFLHCKRRRISGIRLVFMFDHGSNGRSNDRNNIDELKEFDYYRFLSDYHNINCYSLELDIKNPREYKIVCLDGLQLNENRRMQLLGIDIFEKGLSKNHYHIATNFRKISKNEVRVIFEEMNTPRKSVPYSGTSIYEATLFYYVKQYFNDALNRSTLTINNTKLEMDVYIPSIQVVVEYDGAYWHKDKVEVDNRKNELLGSKGIFVIRVRDEGLPVLNEFNGRVFTHSKTCQTEMFVEFVLHELSDHTSDDRIRDSLRSFSLSPGQLLRSKPNILAVLYCKKRQPNFTEHPACAFWDYKKNGDLNPENIDSHDPVFAWFTCPKGHSLLRKISDLSDTKQYYKKNNVEADLSILDSCPFDSCPFIPHDSSFPYCLIGCDESVERLRIIIQKLFTPQYEGYTLDLATKETIRRNRSAVYYLLKYVIDNNLEDSPQFNRNFFVKNIYQGTTSFFSRWATIEDVNDLHYIEKFYDKYGAFIFFNWELFDRTEFDRQILTEYFDRNLCSNRLRFSIYIDQLFAEFDLQPSDALVAKMYELLKKHSISMERNSKMANAILNLQ